MPNADPWNDLEARWLAQPDKYTERSKRQHRSNLGRFRPHLPDDPADVDLEALKRLADGIHDPAAEIASGTRKNLTATARGVLSYAARLGELGEGVSAKAIRERLPYSTHATTDAKPKGKGKTENAGGDVAMLRERAICALLARTLTPAEAVRVDLEDLAPTQLDIRGPRGNVNDFIVMDPQTFGILRQYVDATGRTLDDQGPLLIPAGNRRSKDGRLTTRSIARILEKAGTTPEKLAKEADARRGDGIPISPPSPSGVGPVFFPDGGPGAQPEPTRPATPPGREQS